MTVILWCEYNRIYLRIPHQVASNYFPNDNPEQPPENRWRSHAHLLYGNWINEIYQKTPYDLSAIGQLSKV